MIHFCLFFFFLILSRWGSEKGSKWIMWNNRPKLLESWGVSCRIPLVHRQNCTVLFQNLGRIISHKYTERKTVCTAHFGAQEPPSSSHVSNFDLVTYLSASGLQRDTPVSFPWDEGGNCATVHLLLECYSWTVIAISDRGRFLLMTNQMKVERDMADLLSIVLSVSG